MAQKKCAARHPATTRLVYRTTLTWEVLATDLVGPLRGATQPGGGVGLVQKSFSFFVSFSFFDFSFVFFLFCCILSFIKFPEF
jgi:hypothetical protein